MIIMYIYQVINNLPIDYDFSTKTKAELKLYGKWFIDNKADRLQMLIDIIQHTPSYEHWKADYTPESLKELGKWLKANVKTEKMLPERYKAERAKMPDYIEVTDWEMTAETISKLIDTGIYFGEVFIKSYPHLKWEQYLTNGKNHADQGHMVLRGFGKIWLNPIRIMTVIGYGLIDNTRTTDRLHETFKVWEGYLT